LVRLLRQRRYSDPLWTRLCLRAGVALLLVSGLALGVGGYLKNQYQNALSQEDLLGAAATYQGKDAKWSLDRPLNLLLIGVDWRKGQPGMIRSDTIMIAHVPRSKDRAYLFSIPRDTIATIPASPATGFRGGQDRINTAFGYGAGPEQDRARGARLLAATLRDLTGGLGFDAAALLDFYGFTDVVSALGGVRMCVDTPTRSIHTGALFPKGCRRMNGPAALDFLRQRKTLHDSDYGRQRHQQQFISAILNEARGQNLFGNPAKVDRLIRAAGKAMTVTTGPVPPLSLLLALRGIKPDRITTIRTPGRGVTDSAGEYVGERLDPAAAELFQAARDERLDRFVAAHPNLVGKNALGGSPRS
jgi:LCP family protein required for cell wall assembly